MNKKQIAKACLALGSSTRIAMFLMAKDVFDGVLLHDIAEKLNITYVTALFHINKLVDAKLLRKKKTEAGVLLLAHTKSIDELLTTLKSYEI